MPSGKKMAPDQASENNAVVCCDLRSATSRVDSRYYSIQAADFVAWSLNRAQSCGDYPHYSMAATFLGESKLYDYDAIVERYANDKWS
jgi:hypothetical protein